MNQEIINEAIRVITESLLTPVIYMIEEGKKTKFIGFFDDDMAREEITLTELRLAAQINAPVEILDIREFDIADELEIIRSGDLVYSMHPALEELFSGAIVSEFEQYHRIKQSYIERNNTTGTLYIQ